MIRRKVIDSIELFLPTQDILLFYGARQVGKTSIMKYLQQNYFPEHSYFFDLEKREYLDLLNKNPDIFILYLKSYYAWDENQKITIFIDEIQYLENPTGFLKYIYDSYPNIKCIISGSSTLEIRGKLKDSLVGRMMKFDILPLSFEEFLIFKNKTNLAKLVGKKNDFEIIHQELMFYFEEYLQFGGYPKIVLSNDIRIKKEYLKQIYSTYIEKDIKDIGRIKEVTKFNMLLRLLANQSGNLLNVNEIANTINVTNKTVQEWLFLLENTFVIKLVSPFSTNIRGELTKMPKIFFIDNGIRNFIAESFEITGNSFENSFFNLVNNAYRNQKINFYRTQDKKEIDFILDGEPVEMKLAYNGKNLVALDYFYEKYLKKGTIVTLSKKENQRYEVRYPWEV